MATEDQYQAPMIKVIYFDEESASDYLDITAGGRRAATSEDVKNRSLEVHAKVEAGLAAKLSWLPFIGASSEVSAGTAVSAAGKSILSKTLSNTILTDYLVRAADDPRIVKLRGLRATAPKDSMAYVKMFTPYMIIARTEGPGIDLARLDEALAGAKGYYELLGVAGDGHAQVLRFNIRAFRNNYGLTDIARMRLAFHGIRVGQTLRSSLNMKAEMSLESDESSVTAAELLDGPQEGTDDLLDVYDIVMAGVEHDD